MKEEWLLCIFYELCQSDIALFRITAVPYHSGQKGIFDYFQFCFLVARSMHLNITRYMRINEVEIVEFQGRKMNI